MDLRMIGKVAAVLVCGSLAGAACAQRYPDRPIHIVVPFSPGGTSDFLGRYLGKKLHAELGQPVIVDNRGGAGGTIGAGIVAKAPPDGYTLLVYHIGLATGPALYKHLSYDPRRDFAPISMLATTPSLLVVNPSLKVSNTRQLIAMAKAHPGRLDYGSAGIGSVAYLGMALFDYDAKIKMTHVPYKGGAPALSALMSGEVQVMVETMPDTIQFVRAGKLKLLAVSTAKRLPELPHTPTIAQSGVPGYDFYTWFGFFAPAKTPTPIVAKLNRTVNTVLRMHDLRVAFLKDGLTPDGSTPKALRELVRSQIVKWGQVLRAAGIRPQ